MPKNKSPEAEKVEAQIPERNPADEIVSEAPERVYGDLPFIDNPNDYRPVEHQQIAWKAMTREQQEAIYEQTGDKIPESKPTKGSK